MKIMIVEDNKITRSLIRSTIEPYGLEIVESGNGAEAVADFSAEHPDIVLMDIEMPEMNGITATQKIRSSHPAARIFMVTLYGDQDLRKAAKQASAEKFILKVDLTELPKLLFE